MSQQSSGAPLQSGALSLIFNAIVSSLNAIGTVWVFVIMILINMDAFGRTLLHHPIYGVNEFLELSLVGIVFLQLADATRSGRLTRSDGFFNLIKSRSPNIGRVMGVTFEALGIIFMLIIIYGSVPLLIESYVDDHYVGEEGLLTLAVWPVKVVIVVGCVVTLLQFVAFAMRYIRPQTGEDDPKSYIDSRT